jgi:glycosyltransferase involved in cell wall biosynthesis
MDILKKNINLRFFDIQPERKLGYYLGYLFSFLYSYPRLLFTDCDSVILENPYLVIFAPIFKVRKKKIVAEYVDYYPANLLRLKNERFFRFQVAKIICRIFHNFVDVITTESVTGKRTLEKWGVPEKKISILPVGIKTNKMVFSLEKKTELRKKFQIPADTIIVGYLGKMVKFYSLENILYAVSKLPTVSKQVKLLFIGDGPYKPDLENLAQKLQLPIIFTGNIPHNEVFAYYSLMDVFIFPLNSLAIKIGEILSIKGPILVVVKGMAEDWIKDEYNGLVAKNSSPLELKNVLIKFLNMEKEKREIILSTQRKFAIENLDQKIISKLYLKLL